MRVFLGGMLAALPLVGAAVGWALGNGPMIVLGFLGFLVAVWGLEIGRPTWMR